MERKYDPIGVFDSGVGGISVLRELMRQMPHESFVYYGDSANAPYGARTPEEVCALTEAHVQQLIDRGAKAIVIACNTATGAAIRFLREKYTQIPIIGMEPAIKPAVQAYPGGRILVMATPVTLSSPGFRRLMEAHADQAEILPAPCSQLARMIESGRLDGEELEEYLRAELADFLNAPPEAVVPLSFKVILIALSASYTGSVNGSSASVFPAVGEGSVFCPASSGVVAVVPASPAISPVVFTVEEPPAGTPS